jgi:ATP-dependent helicase/nuclease subunit A
LKDLAVLDPKADAEALAEEFIVVQGVADLVVILPTEIWLVDFKTDHLTHEELADKVKLYGPQIKLYAAALERIYRRPVKERWLHFLALRKTVACPPAA